MHARVCMARVSGWPLSEIAPVGEPGPLAKLSVSSSTVLPAPDGPTMASTSPSVMVALVPASTVLGAPLAAPSAFLGVIS